jgi:hypothetical protein
MAYDALIAGYGKWIYICEYEYIYVNTYMHMYVNPNPCMSSVYLYIYVIYIYMDKSDTKTTIMAYDALIAVCGMWIYIYL